MDPSLSPRVSDLKAAGVTSPAQYISVLPFGAFFTWDLTIAVVAALLMQAALIIWLLAMRSRRRQAELESHSLARLAETEHKRLNEVVSNVPGVVWETRVDPITRERQPTFVSDYVEKMAGYTPAEWMSAPEFLPNLLYAEDRERVIREADEILAKREPGILNYRWVAKDGRILWVETHVTPVLEEGGKGIGLRGVTLDVTEQKRAEDARNQSEERSRAILEAIPDMMFLQTREGVFLDYHVKDLKDLARPPKEFLGQNVRDVLPADLAAEFLERFRRAEQGEPQIMEYELDVNGRHGWYEARIVLSGDKILSVVRDVTARKLVEIALKENEAQLGAIISSVLDGIVTVDESQRIVLVNAAAEKLFHYSAAELLGQPLDRLISERFREAHRQRIREFREKSTPRRLGLMGELYGVTSNGEEFPIESSISHVELNGQKFYTVILRDITELKQAVDELRQSQERFGKVFRANPQPMSLTTLAEGRYLEVNESFLAVSGYLREEIIGHTSLELAIWETKEAREDFIRQINRSGSIVNVETRLHTKDGGTRVLLSSAEKLDIAGQQCLLIASSDVTERVANQRALQAALAELQELKNKLEAENIYLQEELKLDPTFGEIVGKSEPIRQLLFEIQQVAPTDTTVLITGETGTGKELVARAIHGASARKNKPLIKVNCGALSPTLIESELFGHEKGAFTGAVARKLGRFELASGGTIFLDEIGELPAELQVKLLRVIQESEFERLGGTKTIKTDVRIMAATNRNLRVEVDKGSFREDLWYRLNVYPINVPPLRQRKEDIPMLVEHFVSSYARKFGKTITSVMPREMENLQRHAWPGNVRELANVIERAVIHTQTETLQVVDRFEPPEQRPPTSPKTLEEVEREHIINVLENTGWRIEGPYGAAKILGLNPSTLRTRMLKLGIQRSRLNYA
jgi:PAS domain S-box-containing protein